MISNFYGLNIKLFISIIQKYGYCDKLNQKLEHCWLYYLRQTKLDMRNTIKKFIRIVSVLPAKSVYAEGSFNSMNNSHQASTKS